MERRMIEEASSPAEAARLSALFQRRSRIFRRFLTIAVFFPVILIVVKVLLFSGAGDGSQALPVHDDHIAEWDADDERLHNHIRQYYLYPPSTEPYDLLAPNKRDWSHKRQSLVVDELLGGRKNGFFFEAGAYDGETYSNTLYFEKYLNWTGVMVEPDMANIKTFLSKHRRSYLVRGCIGNSNKPQKVTFYGAMETGTTAEHMNNARYWVTSLWRPVTKFDVWCWPLTAVFKVLKRTKIDYFVLDVEGHEMPILQATDFSQLDIDVFQVEYMVFGGAHWDRDESRKRMAAMRKYFKTKHSDVVEHSRIFLDLIFAKRELLKNSPQKSIVDADYSDVSH